LPAADAAAVDAARSAVTAALKGGQRYAFASGIGAGVPPSVRHGLAPERMPRFAPSTKAPLVLRRELPLQPLAGPGALPAWAAGRASEMIGSLKGSLGQQVLIDVFKALTTTSVRRASAASPFLLNRWPSAGVGCRGAWPTELTATPGRRISPPPWAATRDTHVRPCRFTALLLQATSSTSDQRSRSTNGVSDVLDAAVSLLARESPPKRGGEDPDKRSVLAR
jgi:hypothetical protein